METTNEEFNFETVEKRHDEIEPTDQIVGVRFDGELVARFLDSDGKDWIAGSFYDGDGIDEDRDGTRTFVVRVVEPVTVEEVAGWRKDVADRLALAEERGSDDPIAHRLDEYRACLVELDEWEAELAPVDDEPDFSDATHCRHGSYVGDWAGPDYLCGWCEDGVSVSEMLEARAFDGRVRDRAKLLVAENVYDSLVDFGRREGLSVGRMGTYLVDGVLAAADCSPPSSFVRAAREELVGASS